ncbi:MAG: hypothetical protein ABR915_25685, partial [Thermoguttaceae bacterium]
LLRRMVSFLSAFKQDGLDRFRVKQQRPLGLNMGNPARFSFSAKPPHGHAKPAGHRADRQQLGLSGVHAHHCPHNGRA